MACHAAWAACCSASFLLRPVPVPYSTPPTRAAALKVFSWSGPLSLTNSIVWEASPTLIDYGTTNPPSAAIILRDDIVSQDAGTFPFVAGTLENVHVLDPQFESYWGPYQPGPGSPAIDYSANGQATDARGILRPVDLRERGDNRTFDVGAFERYLPVYADQKGTE